MASFGAGAGAGAAALSLESPTAFNTLCRVACQIITGRCSSGSGSDGEDDGAAAGTSMHWAMATQLKQFEKALDMLQMGVPCVVIPGSSEDASMVQVVCPKAQVAVVYKALYKSREQLGIQLKDVKSSITVKPMSPSELKATVELGVGKALQARGWQHLHGGMWLTSSFLAAAPGSVQLAMRARLGVDAMMPATVSLQVQDAGRARLCIFSIAAAIKPPASSGHQGHVLQERKPGEASRTGQEEEQCLQEIFSCPQQLRRANRLLYNQQCTVLPTMTPVFIKGIKRTTEDEKKMRSHWLAHFGWHLPDQMPCYYEVSPDPDCDEGSDVPACVLCTSNSTLRAPAASVAVAPATEVSDQLLKDLETSSFKFFGDGNLKACSAGPVAAAERPLTTGLPPAQTSLGPNSAAATSSHQMSINWTCASRVHEAEPLPEPQQAAATAKQMPGVTAGVCGGWSSAAATGSAVCAEDEVAAAQEAALRRAEQRQAECLHWAKLAPLLQTLQAKDEAFHGTNSTTQASTNPHPSKPMVPLPNRKPTLLPNTQRPKASSAACTSLGNSASNPSVLGSAPPTTTSLGAGTGARPAIPAIPKLGKPRAVGGAAAGGAAPKAAASKRKAPAATAAGSGAGAGPMDAGARDAAGVAAPAAKKAKTAAAGEKKPRAPKPPKTADASAAAAAAAGGSAPAASMAADADAAIGWAAGGIATAELLQVTQAPPTAGLGQSNENDNDFEDQMVPISSSAAPSSAAPSSAIPTSKPASMLPPAAAGGATTAEGAGAGDGGAAAARKRTKASDLDSAAVEAKVLEKLAAGKTKDLSVPEMQCFLRARKQPVGGKKADLEARIVALMGGPAPLAAQ